MTDARHQRPSNNDHTREADDLPFSSDDDMTGGHVAEREAANDSRGTSEEDRDVRQGNDYTADPDAGYFGVGSNEGEGNDNLERETTPGYQADKWERGTIMPR